MAFWIKCVVMVVTVVCGIADFASAQSQMEMNAEAQERVKRLYAQVQKAFEAKLRENAEDENFVRHLKEAQSAWSRYVEYHLRTVFPLKKGEVAREVYGSSYLAEVADLEATMISHRIAELGGEETTDMYERGGDDGEAGAPAASAPPVQQDSATTAINPGEEIEFHGLWTVRASNALTVVTKFRNAGTRSIRAFRGDVLVLNDFGEVAATEHQVYASNTKRADERAQHDIEPGEVLYFYRLIFTDGQHQDTIVTQTNPLVRQLKVASEAELRPIQAAPERLRFKLDKAVGPE